MGASIILLSFLLFCFWLPYFTASVDNCLNNQCGKYAPVISYPFRITDRQAIRCGFPGFDLTCNNINKTVLELPFSGTFFVSYISYDSTYNEIELRDPDDCLARRFLNHLNLSGTPFIGFKFMNYSFFNCSSNVSTPFTTPILYYSRRISCLSSSTHTVFATSPESPDSLWLKRNCSLIATVPVPLGRYDLPSWVFYGTVTDVRLTWRWKGPSCKRNCSNYPNTPYTGLPGSSTDDQFDAKKLFISLGIIVPILIASVMYCKCYCDPNTPSRDVSSAAVETAPRSVTTTTGFDVPGIECFPMLVLGESGRLPDPYANTCAICLSEYQPKETLKTLPACNHCFHADCIDEWLHLNLTCPVCRKFPGL